MKCDAVQEHLLTATSPDTPPAPVQYHLAVCPTCRQFQHQLLLVEQHVPLITVPPSSARDRLLRRLAKQSAPIVPAGEQTLSPHGWKGAVHGLRERLFAHPAVVASVAASLAIFFAGWLYVQWQNGTPQGPPVIKRVPADPLAANMLGHVLQLAQAQTTPEKIRILALEANELRTRTQTVVRAADLPDVRTLATVNDLAEQYCRLVEDGVIKRASDVPAQERREVFRPIVEQLVQAGEETNGLARQKPTLRAALEKMAAAARKGDKQLRGLLKETS